MRILAIDPGEKRIGVAISDPTNIIASPLGVIKHISRPIDAAAVAELAKLNQVGLIVIGQSLDDDGQPSPASRRAGRLAEAIQMQCDLQVVFWDESFSTQDARISQIELSIPRHKRVGHLDDIAAVVILQSYLDARSNP